MYLLSPYASTYGQLINSTKVIKEVQDYLIATHAVNLNYEFKEENHSHLVFITGFSKEEQALPVFEHPVVFKNLRNEMTTVVDLRQYIVKSQDQPVHILSEMRDKNAGLFVILRGLFTYNFVNENLGVFKSINKTITAGFGLLISNIINMMVSLDPLEKINVELVAGHYINVMMSTSDDSDKDAISARLANTKFSLQVSQRNVLHVLDMINLDVAKFDDLVENIKSVLPESKKNLITTSVIINALSSYWYGPGRTETMVIGLEHVPTWIALIISATTDASYKHSKLATVLSKYSKQIEANDLPKWVKLYLQESMI